jgi:ATP-grasp domain-containing protein
MRTLIFLTPYYLKYASTEALKHAKENAHIVLIAWNEDEIPDQLKKIVNKTYLVSASKIGGSRPILNYEECDSALQTELAETEADPNNIRIFCQEECHVLHAARLREKYSIPGDRPEMVEKFRDKIKMKQTVAEQKIRIPKYEALNKKELKNNTYSYYQDLIKRLGSKIVIKPINAAGSFEVAIINNYTEFLATKSAIEDSLHHFEYEADEYIEGNMYECDSLVINGEVKFCGILELGCTNFDFVKGRPLTFFTAIPEELGEKLKLYNQAVLKSLNFQNGCTHFEFFLDKDQDPIFLEIAARAVGGIGIPLHLKNSGVNFIDASIYLALSSSKLEEIKPYSKGNIIGALLPFQPKLGKVTELCQPNIISKYDITWFTKIGKIVDPKSLTDTAGLLFAENDNQTQLRKDFDALAKYVPVKTDLIVERPLNNSNHKIWVLALSSAIGGGGAILLPLLMPKLKSYKTALFLGMTVMSIGVFAYSHKPAPVESKSSSFSPNKS